jgi:plastocyanin
VFRMFRRHVSAAATVVCAGVILVIAPGTACASDLEVTVHDPSNKPLEDAVVYAEPVGAAAPASHEIAHVKIDQVDKEFVPLVTVVRTNTEINFPNSDNFRHSIYSFSQPKIFTTKLYSGKHAPPVLFDKPGLVVLGCNIHDMMAAWVVVVDTPYFTKTAANGTSLLKGLEPGDYRVSVWYPGPQFQPGTSQVRVTADGNNHFAVAVDSSASPLPELRAHAAASTGKAGPSVFRAKR